ncbi:MAG TPA: ABC transporter permease [Bacillales bacterium]
MELITELLEFWQTRYPKILQYTLEHITISFLAVLFGILLTLPLGIYLTRMKFKPVRETIFGIANVFQTIPTIALLAIMIPLLGIGTTPAIVALFLYSLLPLLRNTFAGIKSVDPGVIESARGMGLSPVQTLFKIEIPLAFPYIISGIKVTTVYVISWTTLAAVIGAGGLGDLILAGIGLNSKVLIITGTISAILLALLADLVLGFVEKKVTKQR